MDNQQENILENTIDKEDGQGKKGRRHGRKRRIAAQVIVCLLLVVLFSVSALGGAAAAYYTAATNTIQTDTETALKDADAFYQRLSSRMERRYLLDASQTQKECQRLESRNREIDEMFLSLYTDKAKGILTEQRFMKLTATLEQEQEENQRRLQELMRMLQQS